MKSLRLLVFGLFLACMFPGESSSLPLGRAWATAERASYPRLSEVFAGGRLDVDAAGAPVLFVHVQWDTTTTHEWAAFTWRDSSWQNPVFSGIWGSFWPEPGLARMPRTSLIWISTRLDVNGYGRLLWSDFDPGFSAPDTILTTPTQDTEYSGCVVGSRRWVARSDIVLPQAQNRIRIAYSEGGGPWHELPDREGIDESMCAIGPVDSSRAMVVFAGRTGLAWVLLDGNTVSQRGLLDPRPTVSLHPRFRVRPAGGLWMIWSDYVWVHISSYHDGQWYRGDSLQAVHPPGQTFIPSWNDMSRDAAERPVLAWGDLGYAYTYRDVGCAAFPTATGWSAGEEIPGSDDIFTTPTVAVDKNGDAWFAWQLLRRAGLLFNHTYVSATCTNLHVEGKGRRRSLAWTLSEPAPESWWAVFASRNDAPLEQVARVQAGEDLEVRWPDASSPAGRLRYMVRRECLDTRYRWESESISFPETRPISPPGINPFPLPVLKRPMTFFHDSVELSVENAAPGEVELSLYDLQGRLLLTQRGEASSGGMLRVALGAASGPLTPGIYFARIRDAAGRESNAVRFVVLR